MTLKNHKVERSYWGIVPIIAGYTLVIVYTPIFMFAFFGQDKAGQIAALLTSVIIIACFFVDFLFSYPWVVCDYVTDTEDKGIELNKKELGKWLKKKGQELLGEKK